MTRKLRSITDKIPAVVALVLIVLVWYGISASGIVPGYMLPSPVAMIRALISEFPILMRHAAVTLQEAIYGLLIGVLLAFITATLMDRFRMLNRAFYPLLILTQTIPVIAIAPLLVLWMGFGMAPKITLVVVTTYFPITIGLLDGYKSVDRDSVDLLRTMGAGNLQIFRHVKLPAAMPHFFAGLKISASYAVVGGVIAEWLGGFNGLGVYMTRVRKAYAFDKMFAVIFVIVVVSLLLLALVSVIQSVSMPWLSVEKKGEKSR